MIVLALVPIFAFFVIPSMIVKISTKFPEKEPNPALPNRELGIDVAHAIYEYRKDHPDVR